MRALPWVIFAISLAGCGNKDEPPPKAEAPEPPAPSAPVPAPAADSRPALVCFGDSITAGFGLGTGQSFPDILQRDLDRRGLKYRVVNMGVSGDTTQDGVTRISLAVSEKPAVVVLELGGNDGLRGIPIAITQGNLAQMIEAFQSAGARVLLAGMTLPPNYGPQYIAQFEKAYRDLAEKYRVKLIPFLLEGVGGHDEYMQRDRLHPNAAGARKVEAVVMRALEGML
jgi:acyl-CoA thioesterase I